MDDPIELVLEHPYRCPGVADGLVRALYRMRRVPTRIWYEIRVTGCEGGRVVGAAFSHWVARAASRRGRSGHSR